MISVLIAIAVVLADIISKYFVSQYLKPIGNYPLLDGILEFTYVENRGAAFGMLSDNRYVFMVASLVIIAVLLIIIRKFHGQSRLFDICLGLILGGGVGNMIDRCFLGYVVDFIDFCAFDFWTYVFNVADCAVVVGCILAIIFVIFDKNASSIVNDNLKTDAESCDEQ